ncbi:hypothetical protein DWU98_16110 [Dyella monticola]|uniref:IgGFc-binding protein N-terminal domain-containing protein n=1 Tax=Dyella monticola TaxID=1927958 RepID=A0A370WV81_9GAMM|nr:hypothetical protein [Dyella monticola]RDS79961.1 hypothetical protein DWU98_16110 [Dyella monticola]
MFRKSSHCAARTVVVALLVALLSTSVLAYQPPATGLGQSWPNAMDVSVSPHYHVYVFVRDGIRYIQVNDLNGTVRAGVAVADNVILVLPIGVDQQYVSTQHNAGQSDATENAGVTETVYSDGTTHMTATPTSTGALIVSVTTTPSALANPPCTDPFNCAGNVVSGGAGK